MLIELKFKYFKIDTVGEGNWNFQITFMLGYFYIPPKKATIYTKNS